MKHECEQVLAVPGEILDPLFCGREFITDNLRPIIDAVCSCASFVPRDQAETDRSLRQIIPYVVLKRQNEIFMLKRLKAQTEKRLHGLLSLGVGGHINPDGEGIGGLIERSLYRELDEEVCVGKIESLSFSGIINDHSSEVSNFHTGLFYLMETDGASVRETEKMEGVWVRLNDVGSYFPMMETWSQILLRNVSFV